MKRLRTIAISVPLGLALGVLLFGLPQRAAKVVHAQQVQGVVGDSAWSAVKRVNCRLTTSAATSTLVTGCEAPGAGLSLYITDLSVYGGVATGATAAASVQYGTGGTCGTGTAIVYDCQHAATAGCEAHFTTPKRLLANNELCVVDATVGTKFVSVSGYIAP